MECDRKQKVTEGKLRDLEAKIDSLEQEYLRLGSGPRRKAALNSTIEDLKSQCSSAEKTAAEKASHKIAELTVVLEAKEQEIAQLHEETKKGVTDSGQYLQLFEENKQNAAACADKDAQLEQMYQQLVALQEAHDKPTGTLMVSLCWDIEKQIESEEQVTELKKALEEAKKANETLQNDFDNLREEYGTGCD